MIAVSLIAVSLIAAALRRPLAVPRLGHVMLPGMMVSIVGVLPPLLAASVAVA